MVYIARELRKLTKKVQKLKNSSDFFKKLLYINHILNFLGESVKDLFDKMMNYQTEYKSRLRKPLEELLTIELLNRIYYNANPGIYDNIMSIKIHINKEGY